MTDKIDDFHAHLDECRQCMEKIFNLCPKGSRLLQEAGGMAYKRETEFKDKPSEHIIVCIPCKGKGFVKHEVHDVRSDQITEIKLNCKACDGVGAVDITRFEKDKI